MNFQAIDINNSNEYNHKVLTNMLSSNDFNREFTRCVLKAYEDYSVAYKMLNGNELLISCDDSLVLAFIFDIDNSTFKLKIQNSRDKDIRIKHGSNANFTYEFFGQWLEFKYKLIGA